jgi:predicted RNase H-like nuclease (RuvC/YqgF family)
MPINDVIRACESLANLGKKPTIALVKTRLGSQVPLAIVIKGIQQFQNNSEFAPNMASETEPAKLNSHSITTAGNQCKCEDRVKRLEIEINEMKAYIKALQAQVKALIEQ